MKFGGFAQSRKPRKFSAVERLGVCNFVVVFMSNETVYFSQIVDLLRMYFSLHEIMGLINFFIESAKAKVDSDTRYVI